MPKKAKAEQAPGKGNPSSWARPTGPTCSVPQAGGFYFGLGRNASYAAAAAGQIPTLKIGGRIMAIVAACERMVGLGSEAA
jgi:hypothetical protein